MFTTSVSIYEMAQKNFCGSTHSTGKTRLMQITTPSSYGTDGMAYAKATNWDRNRVPFWYVSVTSSLDMQMVPQPGQPPRPL